MGVRYILMLLGVITVALAVVLAWEGQWWAALPDAGFGLGVGAVAYISLRDERRGRAAPSLLQAVPTAAPAIPPASAPLPQAPRRQAGGRRGH